MAISRLVEKLSMSLNPPLEMFPGYLSNLGGSFQTTQFDHHTLAFPIRMKLIMK